MDLDQILVVVDLIIGWVDMSKSCFMTTMRSFEATYGVPLIVRLC